jgi:drug/metabolite transporter (DMT)-like permease
VTPVKAVGFLCGFAGVALVIGPDALSGTADTVSLLGASAILAAALSYAGSTIIARRAGAIEPLQLSVGMLLVGSILVLPGAALELPFDTAPTLVATGAVLLLGIFATGYASVLYFQIVQGPGPAFVSFVNYLVPAWAVIFGALLLDEKLSSAALAGLALILAGIALSEFGPKLRALLKRRNDQTNLLRRIRLAKENT